MTKEFRSFEDAKEFVQKLGLKSYTEWEEYRKSGNKPDNIPSNPGRTYKNIFKGYSDFLGTGRTRNFRSFEDARKFVHLLKIKGGKQWREYCESGNKPKDIPSSPYHVYKNKGWISYGDWLGTGTIASYNIQFKTYSNAKQFVVKLNLKSKTEWDVYCKSGNKPDDIPSNPDVTYKNKGWVGWGDWLGTGNISAKERGKKFRSFTEARKFVQLLDLTSSGEWKEYCKSGNKPDDITSKPDQVYKNKGWINWGDWLGTGRTRNFRSFEDAKKFIRSLNLKSKTEWDVYCKSGNKPNDIPNSPWYIYSKKRKK